MVCDYTNWLTPYRKRTRLIITVTKNEVIHRRNYNSLALERYELSQDFFHFLLEAGEDINQHYEAAIFLTQLAKMKDSSQIESVYQKFNQYRYSFVEFIADADYVASKFNGYHRATFTFRHKYYEYEWLLKSFPYSFRHNFFIELRHLTFCTIITPIIIIEGLCNIIKADLKTLLNTLETIFNLLQKIGCLCQNVKEFINDTCHNFRPILESTTEELIPKFIHYWYSLDSLVLRMRAKFREIQRNVFDHINDMKRFINLIFFNQNSEIIQFLREINNNLATLNDIHRKVSQLENQVVELNLNLINETNMPKSDTTNDISFVQLFKEMAEENRKLRESYYSIQSELETNKREISEKEKHIQAFIAKMMSKYNLTKESSDEKATFKKDLEQLTQQVKELKEIPGKAFNFFNCTISGIMNFEKTEVEKQTGNENNPPPLSKQPAKTSPTP
jgi:hypothetical protein